MLPNIGVPELLIIAFVILLVFGAKRLPEIGSSMGKGIREFKRAFKDVEQSIEDADHKTPPTRQLDQPAGSERSGERSSGEPKKLSE